MYDSVWLVFVDIFIYNLNRYVILLMEKSLEYMYINIIMMFK